MKEPAFRWCGLLFLLILLFYFPRTIFANYNIFYDDFVNINANNWEIAANSGGLVNLIGGNAINLSSNHGMYFPYVYLKNIQIPDNNYSISTKFIFSDKFTYGNGLIFSDNLLTNGTNNDLSLDDYIFAIWPANSTQLDVSSTLCLKDSLDCSDGSYNHVLYLPSGTYNEIEIDDVGDHYVLNIGNVKYETKDNSRNISRFWIGNPQKTNQDQDWSSIAVDYFKISVYEANKKIPIVIVPGLGASWDMGAVLSGTDGNNWQVPSFVKQYDGLKNSLINAGYSDTENKNLYTFSYDWRKPLDALADKLDTYIEANIASGEKVNLIGHSLGGLVARAYAQKHGTSRINKIVTVGSPNMGTVQAYNVWEGATTMNDVWWERTALEMTTHFGAKLGESKVNTVQRLAPSLKDLLPTYDFQVFNGKIVPWSSLKQKNDHLNNLNQNFSQIDSLTSVIYSNNIQTNSQIKVTNPSWRDLLLNLWQDGKPIENNPYILANGDGTVTETSAKGPFTNTFLGTGWHNDLVTNIDDIKQIFSVLGLDQTKAIGGNTDNDQQVFIAALRSPGKLDVCNVDISKCNEQLGGYYFPDDKLFILPDYQNENLLVTVSDNGERGKYNLHLGDIDEDPNWEIESGNLKTNGQIDTYTVSSNGQSLSVSDSPIDRNRCKNDGWRWFSFFRFKNQGDCVSFVEKNNRPHNKRFWWF